MPTWDELQPAPPSWDELKPQEAPSYLDVGKTAATRGLGNIGDLREKALSYLPEAYRPYARQALNLNPIAPGALGNVPTSQHLQDLTGIKAVEPQGLGQEATAGAIQMATNPLSYAGAGGLATKLAGALTGGAGAGVGGSVGENIAGTPGRVAGSVIGGGLGGLAGASAAERVLPAAGARAAGSPPPLPKETESTFAPTTVATKAGKESTEDFKKRIRELAIANGTLKRDNAPLDESEAAFSARIKARKAAEAAAAPPVIPPPPATPPVLGLSHGSPGPWSVMKQGIGPSVGGLIGHHLGGWPGALIGAHLGAGAQQMAPAVAGAVGRGASKLGQGLITPGAIRGEGLGLDQAIPPPGPKPIDDSYKPPADTVNTILGPAMKAIQEKIRPIQHYSIKNP